MQDCGASIERETRQGAFAEADVGWRGVEERSQKAGHVWIVAYEEQIFALGAVHEELLEVADGGFGGKGVGAQDF